jgi:hypothetical protein
MAGNGKKSSKSDIAYFARAKASNFATTHKDRKAKQHAKRMAKKAEHRAKYDAKKARGGRVLAAFGVPEAVAA